MVEHFYERRKHLLWGQKMLIVLMLVGGLCVVVFVGGVAVSAVRARDVSNRLMMATML